MKSHLTVESRETIFGGASYTSPQPCSFYHFKLGTRVTRPSDASAFTLIELLVVIAIMGVLAALLLPVVGAVKKHQYIYHTQTEMAQLETAIDRYKAAYGFYPPDNPGNPLTNQLYFELVGTVYNQTNPPPVYTTLDGSAQINTTLLGTVFGPGVGGFVNCTKFGAGEDSPAARNFLPDLRPNQAGTNGVHGTTVKFLLSPVGGPDVSYMPMGWPDVNPWRYVCPGINNPGSYDLWIQLSIGKQTNLICNWTKQVQINSPLP
jgi:prepilin-type N-terminal cleavage/methylation domain-containing protein